MMLHSLPIAALLFFSKFALINADASGELSRQAHLNLPQLSTDTTPTPVRSSFLWVWLHPNGLFQGHFLL